MSIRKPYNDKAGYISSRRNEINNGWVVIYIASEQGLDIDDKYAIVCEKHRTMAGATSIRKARPLLKIPDFCKACMSDHEMQSKGQESWDTYLSRTSIL